MVGFASILESIQVLALAIISAGTIVVGALVAPMIFKQFSKLEAGIAMTAIFERFSQWLELSALVLFVAKLIEVFFVRNFNFNKDFFFINQTKLSSNFDAGYFLSFLLVIAIFVISLYISLELMPKMINAYEDNEKEFAMLHKKSEKLMKINALLAVIALVI